MSDDVVISVEGLGKKYRITHQAERQRYVALRDVVAHKLKAPFQFLRRPKMADGSSEGERSSPPRPGRGLGEVLDASSNPKSEIRNPKSVEDFWALRDVSFEVKRGEVVGIIGRNGAGKSTLLKILSRITEPTEGRIHIKGRVASLLEVGTGFHPELTGRENIFLNGAILGMHRTEIKRKFDEIVAFAEVEKFLDTPVKRYSSGMYVRLAFAVAAHLEPEILIVDEVLAVGDAQFQKKCLGKMTKVASQGRTILFVSHDMSAISRLCGRGLFLERGFVQSYGAATDAVSRYLATGVQQDSAFVDLKNFTDRSGDGTARIMEAELRNANGVRSSAFQVGDTIQIQFMVKYLSNVGRYSHSVQIVNSSGVSIHHLLDIYNAHEGLEFLSERRITVNVPNIELYPDRYYLYLWVGRPNGERADYVLNCLSFTVENSARVSNRNLDRTKGLVFKQVTWIFDSGPASQSDYVSS